MIMSPARFSLKKNKPGECHLADFVSRVNYEHHLQLDSYAALHRWSVQSREAFWLACMEFTGIRTQRVDGHGGNDSNGSRVLKSGSHFWQDQWFPNHQLNYAENLLRFRDNRTALIFRDEYENRQQLSYAQLYWEVARVQHWLLASGVQSGDRVAGFAANRIETVIAMLAATSIGAIWSSCSPDFGVNGILDRFTQIEPRVLFAVSSHCYAGRINVHAATLEKLIAGLPSLQTVVLLPELYQDEVSTPTSSTNCEVIRWQALTADHSEHIPEVRFASLPFNHPLFIMYSSGTTGVPKCIVHSTGGTLLQHRKEHHLHLNLQRDDVLFYFTTCGWMMWNWLISGLAEGATLVLYDGSPFHPRPQILFDVAQETDVSIFGTSAKYLSAAEKADVRPQQTHALPRLHTLLSTGSPLSAEGFDYVYRDIKTDVSLQSISGGTDIISCFVLGSPVLPVNRGEIQCAGLGMDVKVYNNAGQPVTQEKGELVCQQSFPSMPTGFWGDTDHKKYQKAYFARFDNIWTHGDYAEQSANGGWIIYGRSDTVLNPGGVRIGTAELYRQVEQLDQVLECVAVGQEWENDVRIVLFVRLQPGLVLDEQLIGDIKLAIRHGASPRHVPAVVRQVSDIPRTLNGKIAEIAVRETLHGRPVNNLDALANPDCLAQFSAVGVGSD